MVVETRRCLNVLRANFGDNQLPKETNVIYLSAKETHNLSSPEPNPHR